MQEFDKLWKKVIFFDFIQQASVFWTDDNFTETYS